jgi:iron complex outermembrane receptor protein
VLIILLGCGLAAQISYAQQAGGAQSATQASSESADTLQEVVVTAERRRENLQDVPIVVDVLTDQGALKAGIIDNMTLQTQVPGLVTSRENTGAAIYLRGVGTIAAPGVENAVAAYVDDVYVDGFAGNILSFNNIDSVEVLKGPQGTLFGRNATGGVINITTKNPTAEPSLDVQAGYGNYQTFETTVYGTTGIGPNLAVNIAYHSRDQMQGWGRDFTTGQEVNLGQEQGVRAKVLWTPTAATSVQLMFDHYWDNYDYGLNQTVQPGTLSADGGSFAGDYNTLSYNPFSPYGPGRSGQNRHLDTYSITVNHDFGWATLKSVTAARDVANYTSYSQGGGPGNYNDARWPQHLNQYSEEIHLASEEGAQLWGRNIHWQGGLYFLKIDDFINLVISGPVVGGNENVITPFPLFSGSGENYIKSYAAFYDVTYDLTPTTALTLGVRETADRIRNHSSSVFVGGDGTPSISTFPDQDANANSPTYRAVLDHKFLPDVMGYLSFSHGFKSGGFGLFSFGSAPTLPEHLDAYMVGLKSDWFDHRFRANLEAFDYEYTNQQVEIIKGGAGVELNAAASRIYGLDATLTQKVSDRLTLSANAEYLHGRYLSFPSAVVFVQNPATCTPLPARLPGPLVPGDTQCAFNGAGNPTIRSPKYSGDVGFDFLVLDGGDRGQIDWTGNYYRTATFDWDVSGQFPEPSFGLISTALTWTSPAKRYDVQLWCYNCGNTYHDTFIAESGPDQQKAPEAPREFGLRFGLHFK